MARQFLLCENLQHLEVPASIKETEGAKHFSIKKNETKFINIWWSLGTGQHYPKYFRLMQYSAQGV